MYTTVVDPSHSWCSYHIWKTLTSGTIFGTAGYIAALKYLPPTVVSVAMLSEPMGAALLGWLVRVNALPSRGGGRRGEGGAVTQQLRNRVMWLH